MTDEQREALLDRWEQAATGWGRQAERWAQTLAPVTDTMFAAVTLEPGVRVLELAAGPGELSRRAAPLVAPTTVLCSDGVEAMLEVARELAADDGVENIEFQRFGLEWIDLPAASADVIFCRYGLMLAVDPEAAFRECRRVLAPGATLVAAVQADAERNPWLTVPVAAAEQAGLLEPSESGGPGPFDLADPAALGDLIRDVGFFDATVIGVDFSWSYANELDWLGEKIDHSPSFGIMWRGLDDARRGRLRGCLGELAGLYRQPDGTLRVPGRGLVAVAEA
jgi:SAM-dependent methyltransferase